MTDKPKHKPKRKGGTTFPRINLEDAVNFANKLVAKTHTGSLDSKIIYPGVFGSKGAAGEIRASALKQ